MATGRFGQLGWKRRRHQRTAQPPGVATTSSRFARINDVLKEDRLAAIMKRGTLLRNAVTKSSNEDLEARVASARIACDLFVRFDLPLERMKMTNAPKA